MSSYSIEVEAKQGKFKEILYRGVDISYFIGAGKALEIFKQLNSSCQNFKTTITLTSSEYRNVEKRVKAVEFINKIKSSNYCIFGIFENSEEKSLTAVCFSETKSSKKFSTLQKWLIDKINSYSLLNAGV